MIYGVGNEFTDFSANLDQQRLIGGTVVAVDFADVFAVGDLAGEGFRVVADVGGERVDRTDQAGVVHERVSGTVVGRKRREWAPNSMLAPFHQTLERP